MKRLIPSEQIATVRLHCTMLSSRALALSSWSYVISYQIVDPWLETFATPKARRHVTLQRSLPIFPLSCARFCNLLQTKQARSPAGEGSRSGGHAAVQAYAAHLFGSE